MLNQEKKKQKGTSWFKNLLFYFVIILLGISFFYGFAGKSKTEDKPLHEVITKLKEGISTNQVESTIVENDSVTVKFKDGQVMHTKKERGESFVKTLETVGIKPDEAKLAVSDTQVTETVLGILSWIVPTLAMVFIFYFLIRQARVAGDNIFSFSKSRAKVFNKDLPKISFADVAGVDEAKTELQEVIEFLKTPEKFKALGAKIPKGVLLLGPSGVGKCVVGDTIVWTNKGLMEIKDIPRYYYVDPLSNQVYGANLASFDFGKVANKEKFASHWFDLGEQKTIKIRLSQGFSLEGTPEHPVVLMNKEGSLQFKLLEEIEEGDYVAVQYGRELFGNLDLVDKDTAYLMGLLTGDGNLSHASRIGLTSIDPEIIKFFKDYVQKRFPKNAITFREQSYLVASWDFKKLLYRMGMSYLLSFDKVVPPTILQAPKPIQVAFLQGLFDTDAAVEKNRATIEYTTVSERMARQIQMTLLNLGVIASLNIRGRVKNGYHRPVYRLNITGSAFIAFSKFVNFRLSRKQKMLLGHVKKMKTLNTNVDIIPHVAHLVEESWKELSTRRLSKEKLSKTIDKVRRRDRISRQVLKDYVNYANALEFKASHLRYFETLLKANFFFSPVVEKSYSTARVYDFTVPQTHSFLGNGFLNHNTLLARAVAGEANVPFFSIAGSEFMEMLVGVGASRVRDLFETAKKNAPAIVFIDEIDSIGRQRGLGLGGGHDEREQTLNQILVEMDGFEPNTGVIVCAATNRPDMLDPALVRPGRFDRRVVLDLPDIEGRKAIIKIHSKNKPLAADVDIDKVARRTVGFSGADIENMLNEAAIFAARLGKKQIQASDLEEAALKVKLGPEKKRLQSEEDRRMTAYHEAGHALVTAKTPYMDPVHRVSIVARGVSLGHTMIPPAADRYNETETRLKAMITSLLGGRAAEEIVLKEFTVGAASDIEKATQISRQMVTQFGMSRLGPSSWGFREEAPWVARELGEMKGYSEEIAAKIDEEVKRIIGEAYEKAKEILVKNRDILDLIALELMKKETLEGPDFEELVKNEKPKTADVEPSAKPTAVGEA